MNSITLSTLATDALIGTTAIGLAAMGLSLLLRRFSAATRHYYWLMIITCLLLWPALSAVSPKYRVEVPSQAAAFGSGLSPLALPVISNASGENGSPPATTPTATLAQPSSHQDATDLIAIDRNSTETPFRLRSTLFFTWTTGSVFFGLWITIGWLRIRHLLSQSVSLVEGKTKTQCSLISQQMKGSRPFKILVSKRTLMPMVVGTKNATLVLPAGFEDWNSTKQAAVLAHEIGHIQRYDCSTQLLGQFLCLLYWFHPISWIISRKLQAEAEAACDDLAIRSGTSPSQYAEHLLTIARSLKGLRILTGTSVQMAGYSKLENRLRRILNSSINRNRLTRISVLVCSTTTLTFALLFSTIRISANDSEDSGRNTSIETAVPAPSESKAASSKEQKITLSVKELNQLSQFATVQTAAMTSQAMQKEEKSDEPESQKPRESSLEFTGRLESATAVTIRNQLDSPAAILWRAAEGDTVEKGDLILEFESHQLVDDLESKKIELVKDEGEINTTRSLLEDLRKNKALEIETSELTLRLMELKQEKGQADFKLRLKRAEGELNIAIKRLEEAEAALQVTQAHFKAGVAGAEKVRSASIAAEEAKYKNELAIDTRENLLRHDRAYEDIEHRLAIQQAKSALHNILTQSNNKIRSAEEELQSLIDIHSIKKARAEGIERRISKCKIYAPISGFITGIQGSDPINNQFYMKPSPTPPGTVIGKHHPVFSIQDSAELAFRFYVPSGSAPRISPNQAAWLVLEDAPGNRLKGKVTKISQPKLFISKTHKRNSVRHGCWITVSLDSEWPHSARIGQAFKVELEE